MRKCFSTVASFDEMRQPLVRYQSQAGDKGPGQRTNPISVLESSIGGHPQATSELL